MPFDVEKINVCFLMWIEFGPTLGAPLDPRIKKKFPEFTTIEISQYAKECVSARNLGHKFVYDKGVMVFESPKKMNEEFVQFIKSKHNWMNDENIQHLYSQSCYYAMK